MSVTIVDLTGKNMLLINILIYITIGESASTRWFSNPRRCQVNHEIIVTYVNVYRNSFFVFKFFLLPKSLNGGFLPDAIERSMMGKVNTTMNYYIATLQPVAPIILLY